MSEFANVIQDILNGNLPANELPGFAAYIFRHLAWFLLAIILAGALGYLIK